MEDIDTFLFKLKGYYFGCETLDIGFIENLNDFEIKEDGVFIITYSKSGTIWFQQLLSLIYFEEHHKSTGNLETVDQIPFFEYNFQKMDLLKGHLLVSSHLPHYLVPSGEEEQKLQITHVYRNPKVIMCSYFHFSKNMALAVTSTFEGFIKCFLEIKCK
ncbi:amine sulfotransferase-like [Lynx canadensis]|uniref:amine sulfotransferase-like n=1 Tax=Lynx canadensis TaxID=61383 RepID=UPI0011B0A132|nr:amine sulfotransferase-like [Lynx canadensis]